MEKNNIERNIDILEKWIKVEKNDKRKEIYQRELFYQQKLLWVIKHGRKNKVNR